jgi:hypothetical protein
MKKPGRPPLDADDASVQVSCKIPGKDFDALCQRAQDNKVSLAALVRQMIQVRMQDKSLKN